MDTEGDDSTSAPIPMPGEDSTTDEPTPGTTSDSMPSDGTTEGEEGEESTTGEESTGGEESPYECVEQEPATEGVQFEQVCVPATDAEKREVRASSWVRIEGTEHEIGFNAVLRTGDAPGESAIPFGTLVNEDGEPIVDEAGEPLLSAYSDFQSLIEANGAIYSINHIETTPGQMYISEYAQDAETGALTAISTAPIDFSSVHGLWTPCAGSVTPWGTHLGGEEYPPDAKLYEAAETPDDLESIYSSTGMLRYWFDTPPATIEEISEEFNPYAYGFAVEISIDETGTATPTKHYPMGRRATELAYVMPDQRTVYLTDDGTNGVFSMFVADTAGDLSEGTLYAARWTQTSDEGAGAADLTWVPLAETRADRGLALINAGVVFSDIFEIADPTNAETGECPEDFVSINTGSLPSGGHECLRLNDGIDGYVEHNDTLVLTPDDVVIPVAAAAAMLESTRYAAYLGATSEFRKMEGITFNPAGNLYLAMSEVTRGMEAASERNDLGGPDHIQLEANTCGAVYSLPVAGSVEDSEGNVIASEYVATAMSGLVVGEPREYPFESDFYYNICDLDGIANPDNVTYIPAYNTLIIGEDSGSEHENDAMWAYDVEAEQLTRIETTPYGSETTSPYWYPSIGGYAYLQSVVQHPYGELDSYGDFEMAVVPEVMEEDETRAYVGYIGPFPPPAGSWWGEFEW
jgi:hypothetical protein